MPLKSDLRPTVGGEGAVEIQLLLNASAGKDTVPSPPSARVWDRTMGLSDSRSPASTLRVRGVLIPAQSTSRVHGALTPAQLWWTSQVFSNLGGKVKFGGWLRSVCKASKAVLNVIPGKVPSVLGGMQPSGGTS